MKLKPFILIAVLLGAAQLCRAQAERSLTKDHVYLKFHSEVLSQDRVMLVMLPRGYTDAPEKR